MVPLTMEIQLKEVVKDRKQSAATIMAHALKIGMASLYRESVLKSYLLKRLSRQKAVARLGAKTVFLAEEQQAHALADIDWGMKNGTVRR